MIFVTAKKKGTETFFIDEVTLLSDYIEGFALFSDIFVACGMKIVLTGTDSLGLIFTEDEQMYDRCILLHTTFISYRESEYVLGISGIDQYIQYGGTMSLSGSHYHSDSVFSSKKRTDEYADTAIANNIQHSLRYYQDEGHFRNLHSLYECSELTNVINRVVEDINHRFTLATPQQYRHLINPDKCTKTEHLYGEITHKAVIYRGESTLFSNAEEYLKNLNTSLRHLLS